MYIQFFGFSSHLFPPTPFFIGLFSSFSIGTSLLLPPLVAETDVDEFFIVLTLLVVEDEDFRLVVLSFIASPEEVIFGILFLERLIWSTSSLSVHRSTYFPLMANSGLSSLCSRTSCLISLITPIRKGEDHKS